MSGKIFIGITVVMFLSMIFFNNSLASRGRELDGLMEQKRILESQLLELDNQIAEASSLGVIRKEAAKLGMVPGKLHFLPPVPVALAPQR